MFDIRYSSGRIAEDINSSVKTIDMSGVTYPLTVKAKNIHLQLMYGSEKLINLDLNDGENAVINNPAIEKLMVSGELIPDKYLLEQNYPNPFNPNTVISFQLPVSSNVSLKVFDILGNEISTIVNGYQPAGKYEFEFSGANLPSGVYFYTITAGQYSETKKMILMK